MGAPAAGLAAPELGKPAAPSGRRTIIRIVVGLVVVVALGVGGWFGWHTFNHPAAAPPAHSQSAPAKPTTTSHGSGGGG